MIPFPLPRPRFRTGCTWRTARLSGAIRFVCCASTCRPRKARNLTSVCSLNYDDPSHASDNPGWRLRFRFGGLREQPHVAELTLGCCTPMALFHSFRSWLDHRLKNDVYELCDSEIIR